MGNNVEFTWKAKAISITLREDVVAKMDNWLEKKEKETGGKFTRSGFVEKAIIAKIKECDLMDEEKNKSSR